MVERIQTGLFTLDSAENLGAIEIATFLGLILLGFALSQAYTFFRQSENDKWWLKCLWAAVRIFRLKSARRGQLKAGFRLLEITHTLAACMDIYLETVLHPGRNEANSYPLSVNALTENIITFIVQWFFSWRIYRLSKRFPLSLACSSLAALRFIGAVVISVQSFLDVQQKPNGVFVFTFRWLITSALAVGVLADILIAASMIFYLQQLSSPMNRRWTTETLNHLVLWTLDWVDNKFDVFGSHSDFPYVDEFDLVGALHCSGKTIFHIFARVVSCYLGLLSSQIGVEFSK
ncbi:hypothetical protein CVT26_002570 [Gymnopilus dilepis]|uniref:Uncharacterized protein n=1 Tax=Gymnopilus dilepis TaxID=231916 RepID=A0A409VSW5_9AGAR|nr:hypothetical protein CVT26_002570 [Gymnopilus dilepis]